MPHGKRPHLLIFNPDQWRGDVVGHFGHPAVHTPNLDQAAPRDFVSFRNAFCQSPVCTPSRCSFMTGWYPHVRGHRTMHHMLHPERGETNLLKLLKDAGYYVWWGGKNDLVPAQHGFEPYCHVKFKPTPEDYRRWGHQPRPTLHAVQEWRGVPGSDNYFSFFAGQLPTDGDNLYCDSDWANVFGAIDMIRSAPREQPLCIFLPLEYPHPPYGVEEPWFSQVRRDKLPPRVPIPDQWRGKPSMLARIAQLQAMQGWSERRWDELRATYCGMCARVDHQFGLMLDALRQAGLYDDTAILFLSDHGDFTGDYGLVEKTQNTFEDCLTRVPLLIKPPHGVPVRPRVCDALVELVDIPATVFELTGIAPGYTHFGRSLLPLVGGEVQAHRDAVFCEGGRLHEEIHCQERESCPDLTPEKTPYYPRMEAQRSPGPEHTKAAMCRTDRWKFVHRLYEADELYDLRQDPMELRNLVEDPAHAPILAQMRERLLRWFLETADVVPFETDRR